MSPHPGRNPAGAAATRLRRWRRHLGTVITSVLKCPGVGTLWVVVSVLLAHGGVVSATPVQPAFHVTVNGFVLLTLEPSLPVLEEGRTWIPVEALVALTRPAGNAPSPAAAGNRMDPASGRLTVALGTLLLTVQPGRREVTVRTPGTPERTVLLSASARRQRGDLGRVLVPLRDLAPLLGAQVQWDAHARRTALQGAGLLADLGGVYDQQIVGGTPTSAFRLEHIDGRAVDGRLTPDLQWAARFTVAGTTGRPVRDLDAVVISAYDVNGHPQVQLMAADGLLLPKPPDAERVRELCHAAGGSRWACVLSQAFPGPQLAMHVVVMRVVERP